MTFDPFVTINQPEARLKNVFPGNFVDAILTNRFDSLPAGTRGDAFGLHRLATPRGQKDFRVCLTDLLRRHDSLGSERAVAQFGENILTSGALDQFADPRDARD